MTIPYKLLGERELRRNKGQSVTCLGHDNCTSNIPANDNIGNEKRFKSHYSVVLDNRWGHSHP